jgi:tetratricopeptide (TPR) repeat protein
MERSDTLSAQSSPLVEEEAMSLFNDPGIPSGQPSLSDLLARYLNKQMVDHADGLGRPELLGEVVPFEAAPVQPVDARLAWDEAIRVLDFYNMGHATGARVPPQWSQLVAAHEPVVSLAFCVANFPQLVRNFQPLLQEADPAALRPVAGRPVAAPALTGWAADVASRKQFPQTLLALGALRLAKQHDQARALLRAHEADVPAEWQAGWANERAALAWHAGRCDEAYASWQEQAPSVPVLFNRGMAALFLGNPAEARKPLADAVSQLPEAGAWHHLGRLYLTLAESRR